MERGEVLARLRERIVAFAASRMGRDVAEDFAQDVLMVIEQRYAAVTVLDELLPLALQILRFKMAAARRKSLRRGEGSQVQAEEANLAGQFADPETQARREETLRHLSEAVRELGDRCREILRLKLLGKSFAEIQEELGASSINTVYTWDARCRKQLLERMGGNWEGKR